MNKLALEAESLRHQIIHLQLQYWHLRDKLKARMPLGRIDTRNGGITIYQVKRTKVKTHWRNGYRALRVNNHKAKTATSSLHSSAPKPPN